MFLLTPRLKLFCVVDLIEHTDIRFLWWQIVAFTDVLMRFTNAKRTLIIVPINTLQNWINEFDMWLPCPKVAQVCIDISVPVVMTAVTVVVQGSILICLLYSFTRSGIRIGMWAALIITLLINVSFVVDRFTHWIIIRYYGFITCG